MGLASVLGTAMAPVAGAIAFRRLGLLDRLPASLQPRLKQLHRRVSFALADGAWAISEPVPQTSSDMRQAKGLSRAQVATRPGSS